MQRLAMCRHGERAEPAGQCLVVVFGFSVKKMEERGQGAQEMEDKMAQRWWRKCQRTFSNPSLRLLDKR